tara:strand:- start:601 stop:900 length:300 start_codon:yes stop_codon:yes gene_type:complete
MTKLVLNQHELDQIPPYRDIMMRLKEICPNDMYLDTFKADVIETINAVLSSDVFDKRITNTIREEYYNEGYNEGIELGKEQGFEEGVEAAKKVEAASTD